MKESNRIVTKSITGFLIIFLSTACLSNDSAMLVNRQLKKVQIQYLNMIEELNYSDQNPRSITPDGKIRMVRSKDWTSGFFPGSLWRLYEYSGNEKFKEHAIHYSKNMFDQQFNDKTHDMGFKMYCSLGNGLRITQNPEYKKILLQSAKTLSTRFNEKIGCIRSWDHNKDKWQYPVIIDNLMNLELLFWATKITNDSTFYNIAISHANKTMANHFRADFSSYHVVSYDTLTGEVRKKNTHQGLSHDSSWARGQAWALYGYTMCFRETSDSTYLNLAEKIADYLLHHPNLPSDMVPFWDFDAPTSPNQYRDASAAAIICSALYELSLFSVKNNSVYKNAADKILHTLSKNIYLAKTGTNNNFILKHSVGNKAANSEVDVAIIYADYYYIEALLRNKTWFSQ